MSKLIRFQQAVKAIEMLTISTSMYMVMSLTGITMATIITGTTIIIDLGGDIIDIALGILGLIIMSPIITDGHITALITHTILIPITVTTPITIITDQLTTQIPISM